jgi:hypothetical protein
VTSANTWDEWRAEQVRKAEFAAADERRRVLIRHHGKPERASEAAKIAGLAKLGRQDIDPAETIAYVYRDQAAADTWQRSTAEHCGVPSLGTVPVISAGRTEGILGIYDLRLG